MVLIDEFPLRSGKPMVYPLRQNFNARVARLGGTYKRGGWDLPQKDRVKNVVIFVDWHRVWSATPGSEVNDTNYTLAAHLSQHTNKQIGSSVGTPGWKRMNEMNGHPHRSLNDTIR